MNDTNFPTVNDNTVIVIFIDVQYCANKKEKSEHQ